MAKVLVTDGNNRAALAITRSLGREGHEVVVSAETEDSLAGSSRFCRKHLVYPQPQNSPSGFVSSIGQIIEKEKPDVVLPVSEITTLLITGARESIGGHFVIPFPSHGSVDSAAQKREVLRLAQQMGVPIPRTRFLESLEDVEDIVRESPFSSFPVVVKPSRSRIVNVDGWRPTAVRYARSEAELLEILTGTAREEYPLLLQERIHGPGVGIFTCFNEGRLVAAFSHRRIREKPPSGGVSVFRESIAVNEDLKAYAEALLSELKWHGVAMVEFKQDLEAGDYKLMEINGRFWGSLQLAIDAGVNFPSLAVAIALGKPRAPVASYRIGVKTRWLWGDVDALLTRLLKPDSVLNLPPGAPSKMKYLWQFMTSIGRDVHLEILDLDDTGPWVYETRSWFLH